LVLPQSNYSKWTTQAQNMKQQIIKKINYLSKQHNQGIDKPSILA
jgi:hypothetical protein